MSRPQKYGVDYFPKDTSFYSDDKVCMLRAEFGVKGMYILDYLLCDLYAKNGYYANWDKSKCFLVSDGAGCGCNAQFVDEFVRGCVRCSFFDERVFNMFGVLTSRGIQKRFVRMLRGRKRFLFIREYFLLNVQDNEDVPESYLGKIGFKSISCAENGVSCAENEVLCAGNTQIKEKKKETRKKKAAAAAEAVPKSGEDSGTFDLDFGEVMTFYTQNIGLASGIIGERISDWLQDVDKSLVLYAIEQAALHNKRHFAYINAILNRHFENGRKTRAEAEAFMQQKSPDCSLRVPDGRSVLQAQKEEEQQAVSFDAFKRMKQEKQKDKG